MPDIKRGTTSIINLERGSTDINFVYRGSTLIWSRTTPTLRGYVVNGVEYSINKQTPINAYVVDGVNIDFK